MSMPYAQSSSSVGISTGYALRLSTPLFPAVGLTWGERVVLQERPPRYQPGDDADRDLNFGPFRLLPGSRTLLHEEQPVECGSRAFDLLHVLLLSRGKVVSKDDIVRHVWPTTCVEESNLRFQMASLRKVLGTYRDLIKTIPGRGYLLASDFVERAEPAG